MSVEVAHEGHHGHSPLQAHQFEDMEQQNECYTVGMWTFLVTEIMFFGALFLAYTIYRHANLPAFYAISNIHLDIPKGATNTVVLLTSSFTMAMAVYHAQKANRNGQLLFLALTILLSFAFLVIKGFEWEKKFVEHHVPGPYFHYVNEAEPGQPPIPADEHVQQSTAQMFFSLYFAMTGLHAVHVIIGIVVMGTLFVMILRRHPSVQYFMPVEMAGLYWHFVDIVWIFLFPLFYLIPHQ